MKLSAISLQEIPIEWSKENADIMALAGICKDNPVTIEEIREKAWKRVKVEEASTASTMKKSGQTR